MKVRLVNNSGSGSVADESPISYAFSEDVTSLQPSSLEGGTSQVNVSALEVTSDRTEDSHPNSKLLINNSMSLVHGDSGEIEFKVSQVTTNVGVVNIIGDTLESRLNVERTADPYGAPGGAYTLLGAIEYYCSLVDISAGNGNLFFEDDVDDDLDSISVNFIGWRGNVWEKLKELCAAVSISDEDNVGLEFYAAPNGLTFRRAKTTSVDFFKQNLISQSVSVDTNNTAQEVEIYNYNTFYAQDAIVQDITIERSAIFKDAQNASLSDSLQVSAGETLVKRFTINASLETVNQPEPVDGILPFPYPGGQGQYAISGSDGVFIKADQWIGEGGSLTVALTENPLEIEVTVTAPPKNGLENIIGGGQLSFEPYKVGVETAGNTDYPAIYITGTGVFYNKVSHTIKTGAANEFTPEIASTTIDNSFITNTKDLYTRGVAAAQVVCGPNVTLNETVSTIEPFGTTAGLMRSVESNKYRINTVGFSPGSTNITAGPCASFADFNNKWDGLTFEDFTNTALDPVELPDQTLKFNEFTIIPLMNAEPVE
jgi:hypothetical protein